MSIAKEETPRGVTVNETFGLVAGAPTLGIGIGSSAGPNGQIADLPDRSEK